MREDRLPASHDGQAVELVLRGSEVIRVHDGQEVFKQHLDFASLTRFDDADGTGVNWNGTRYLADRQQVERWLLAVPKKPADRGPQPTSSYSRSPASSVRRDEEASNVLKLVNVTAMVVVVAGIAGVVGGAALALHTEDNGDFRTGDDRPYLVAGLATALGSLTYALLASCVLAYIAWRVRQSERPPSVGA